MPENDDTSVRVALRVRPQLAKERIDMCRVCTSVTPDHPQLTLGQDKAFTYDFVFDTESAQENIYNATVHELIEGCFEGFNATVFAYGQTGAGKTFTMGTGFEPGIQDENLGIVPRAVRHLFSGIDTLRQQAHERSEPPPEFVVNAEFMELYNEEILDLFDSARDDSRTKKSHIKIHEDPAGGIYVVGVTTRTVTSEIETLQCLQAGALSRTTASTNMNSQSSRSHAIFTLHIKQQRLVKVGSDNGDEGGEEEAPAIVNGQGQNGLHEFETLTAKFHFVDLAGSERLKRTGATGDRAKEGISINCGLLALGNVISALGDPAKRSAHVPYRDSKLTRLLQDSLGGNSRTLMIACISPSDRDFMETLNTMRYANRARNIKNAVVANQDKTSRQLGALRAEVKQLQDELFEYKQGKRTVNEQGVEEINDLFHENTMLQRECDNLRRRCKAMQETIDTQTARIAVLVAEQAKSGMLGLKREGDGEDDDSALASMIEGYIKEIEDLRAKLVESESIGAMLRRKTTDTPVKVSQARNSMSLSSSYSPSLSHHGRATPDSYGFQIETTEDTRVASVLAEARKQIEHDQEKVRGLELAGEKPRSRHQRRSVGEPIMEHTTTISGSSDKENEDGEEDHGMETLMIDPEPLEIEEQKDEEEDEMEEGDAEDADEEMGDEDSDSDTDEELDEEEQQQLQDNLADISCEITIKQRLIEELEASQRRLHTLRAQYEEKLSSLQFRIKETEMERDKVLNNLGSLTETRTKEKAEKIRKEFEIKLTKLSAEKNRLQKASKEHTKLMKSKSQHERQMKTLQSDLNDMKKLKVRLMKQVREEQQKSRQKETIRNREIQALKKDSRKKESQIKSMEAKARQKELILKRKQEEVLALRRQKKPMSDKTAGRVTGRRSPHVGNMQQQESNGPTGLGQRKPLSAATQKRRHQRHGTSEYSSKAAKHKWHLIERRLNDIIARRQTVSHMERDMERFLQLRHRLSKKLDKQMRRREGSLKKGCEESVISEHNEMIDGLNANVDYVQQQIMECQANIMEVMEGKDDVDAVDAASIIQNLSVRESKYINEHFLNLAINKGLMASQKEAEIREMEAKLHQEENNSFMQTQLLQHVLQGSDADAADNLFAMCDDDSSSSAESSRAPSPVMGESSAVTSAVTTTVTSTTTSLPNSASMPAINLQGLPQFHDHPPSMLPQPTNRIRDKARRRTATQAELLYAGQNDKPDAKPLLPMRESGESSTDEGSTTSESMLMPPPKAYAKKDSLTRTWNDSTPSPVLSRRTRSREASPAFARRRLSNHALSDLSNSATTSSPPERGRPLKTSPSSPEKKPFFVGRVRNIAWDAEKNNNTPTGTPPGSPPMSHRIRNENVFSRLTQSRSPAVAQMDKGSIQPVQTRNVSTAKAPLVCCYTAEGHTKAVLSVQATDDLLFSGSKDRTVKIWKLNTGQELTTLTGHPNNVVTVRYNQKLNLVFSVSTAYVRVWDIRDAGKCIKTLSSAGHVLDSNAGSSASRTVAMPTGETQINDIIVNEAGTRLYAATGNIVRVWDLSSFQSTCKLYGGASAAVMCVAVNSTSEGDQVFAGSKDHYVKMFEVSSASSGCLTPKFNLDPPHYDGIQSIAINKGKLFSGSRDACIKKWDLKERKQLKSINGAHKDWICSLDFLPGRDCLISGCRGGILKLWQTKSCAIVGEMKAHTSPINSIATNSTHVFTASSDRTVSVWQPRSDES